MANIVSFGEILLRLASENHTRFGNDSKLSANFGGSEMNVGVSLSHFGHNVRVASVLPKNRIGTAVKQFLHSHEVSTEFICESDGRMGIYFVEAGAGNRGGNVIYDRAYSVFSQIKEFPFELAALLKGCDLLFVSGITPALSEELQEMTLSLLQTAKKMGVRVAYDNNYREKLWSTREAAFEMTRKILPYVDILSAGILDIRAIFQDESIEDLATGYDLLTEKYPNIQAIFSTNRTTHSTEDYELQGNLYVEGKLYQTEVEKIANAIDRIGGGDAYAAGILHGLINGMENQETVSFGVAATVLKHTVYGDVNLFSEEEVLAFMRGGKGIKR
ncbi:2-dehydro-3-deoxygluconokinase [Pilibacter termitis]|uniref:2-dehydro-3-deoxygluconokinase n=1 Tax=Pilibacter termitis TaxID=263852 RepID=A0A1T4LY56_9ENTE|nr:sugar kinase [Pilibacter termitis]SJZ59571.1 2-dehydro-3-deoxygluconokinase [Pilibacter termitis]